MTAPVGVEGGKETVSVDAIRDDLHAAQGVFLEDKEHVVYFTGSVIHDEDQIKGLPGKQRDPLVRGAVDVEHHADERFAVAPSVMFAAASRYFDIACGLKGKFDEGIAAMDVMDVLKFFVEVGDVESFVLVAV